MVQSYDQTATEPIGRSDLKNDEKQRSDDMISRDHPGGRNKGAGTRMRTDSSKNGDSADDCHAETQAVGGCPK